MWSSSVVCGALCSLALPSLVSTQLACPDTLSCVQCYFERQRNQSISAHLPARRVHSHLLLAVRALSAAREPLRYALTVEDMLTSRHSRQLSAFPRGRQTNGTAPFVRAVVHANKLHHLVRPTQIQRPLRAIANYSRQYLRRCRNLGLRLYPHRCTLNHHHRRTDYCRCCCCRHCSCPPQRWSS